MGHVRTSRAAFAALVLVAAVAPVGSAAAQSFDCAKARTPIEQAICGSPSLSAQDRALADAYVAAQAAAASDSPEAAALRDAQRAWVSERNRNCSTGNISACLAAAYRARLAALAGAPKAAATALPPPAPPPAVAVQPVPAGAATLSATKVSAAGEGRALLQVERAGRFAISAKSPTGVALQLVDMIAGPGDLAGEAGLRDGRLDVLLDRGTYKLKTFGAKDAKGEASLAVAAFNELEAPGAQLGAGQSAQLGDGQQRSYWLAVGRDGEASVEAVGRALQDLRLWRNGRDMADLKPAMGAVEPKAGRPMTRVRLEGKVEPGAYLVTAYGGAPETWTDGDASMPFHIRSAEPLSLAAGVAEATLGPFGFARFRAAANADRFRLELQQIAPVEMSAQRGEAASAYAAIGKASREPVAQTDLAAQGGKRAIVEVSGREGQAFRLRALQKNASLRFEGVGPHLISVALAGEGGDEAPATAVLARMDGKARVIAANAPRLGPGQAWRRKFNLRGPTSFIFEMTAAGPVALRAQGPAFRAAIEPLLGSSAPRADGRAPGKYDLEAGWYLARIEPNAGARGAFDLIIGAPGLVVDPTPPAPPRAAIEFGVRTLERGGNYQIIANSAPGLTTAPRALALPADLAKGPLALTQSAPEAASPPPRVNRPLSPPRAASGEPGPRREPPRRADQPPRMEETRPAAPPPPPPPSNALEIAARAPLSGDVAVTDERGNRVAFAISDEKIEKTHRTMIVRIPASDRTRHLAVVWTPAAPPRGVVAPEPEAAVAALKAGEPVYFDLKRDEKRAFRLDAPQGGLMRVETLGRLKTSAVIGTSFLPRLDEAEENGAGHNALLQTYLRAGAYRVSVAASDSAGRLGLVARPAQLTETGPLAVDGSVRAALADGEGAIVPIVIAKAGDYSLDLYTLGEEPMARLEDAEGWPLTNPGRTAKIQRRFEPGRYRLVISPEGVETRVVARLRPVAAEVAREGHGPFDLPFERTVTHQWREPAVKDSPRAPDVWRFALAGEAQARLDIGEGMIGELIRGENESLGKFVAKRDWRGKLDAGAYRVEARALGRDDRLDYTLTLSSDEMQPGAPRFVDVPQTLAFTLAEDRVVNLMSFGRIDMTAALKDSDGRIVERLEGRADDWNLSFSKFLPAGRYQLTLSEVTAADRSSDATPEEDRAERADESGEADPAQQPAADSGNDDKVEVSLALPKPASRVELAMTGSARAEGAVVNRFPLAHAEAGRLVAVAARGDDDIVLSLERRDADGRWRVAALDRGREALAAFVADGDARRPWRVSVWSLDGSGSIALAARALQEAAQPLGSVKLNKIAFDDVGGSFCATRVQAPQVGLVTLAGSGLRHGSTPGRALAFVGDGPIAPQSESIWLAARGDCARAAMAVSTPPSADQAVLLGEGERASLAAPGPEAGKARVWRIDSAFGQPGVEAGRGMGVAEGNALALSDGRAASLWNAGGADALRVRAAYADVTLLPARDTGGQFSGVLPARSAQVVKLGSGDKRLMLDLAAGAAAVAVSDARRVTAWSGAAPLSRVLEGAFGELWLVNAGDAPAPVAVALAPPSHAALDAARVFKRFVGAAGSLSLPVAAQAGDVLVSIGAEAAFVGADGRVARGSPLTLSGPGEVILTHQPGLVAAWIERGGKAAWPAAEARATTLPGHAALSGEAMSFALKADAPMLLRARSSAPLIAIVRQGGADAPLVFPAGAELNRYLAAGDATLDVYSPHDGALTGTLELTASPIRTIGEGLGEPVALAPGASVLFGFEVKRAGEIGVGLRSDPDRAALRLMDAAGKTIAEGVNQIVRLAAGRYVLEARAPVDAATMIVRPALVGVSPPPSGPPDAEAARFLDMVGLKSSGTK